MTLETSKNSIFRESIVRRLLDGLLIEGANDNLAVDTNHVLPTHIDKDKEWDYSKALFYKTTSFFDEKIITANLPFEILLYGEFPDEGASYDLLFADIPMGNDKAILPHLSWLEHYMSSTGVIITVFASLNQVERLTKNGKFEGMGLYPSSVLQLPQSFFGEQTAIAPVLVCLLKRDKFNLVYFCEFEEKDLDDNLEYFVENHRGQSLDGENDFVNYVTNGARNVDYLINQVRIQRFADDDNLFYGIFEALLHFPGFEFWKFITHHDEIDSDFAAYEKCYLSSISDNFKVTKGTFNEDDNTIYVPLIGTQPVIGDLSSSRIKHQNLCQVTLNPKRVMASYLITYLNSPNGRMFWQAALAAKDGVIKRLTIRDIQQLVISLPSIEQQRAIAEVSVKIENAMTALEGIKNSLSLNPVSSEQELQKLNSLIDAMSEVSPLLCEESIIHEFKASFKKPYPSFPEPQVNDNGQTEFHLGKHVFASKKKVETFIGQIVAKSIASFLNTRGGTLVIGVHERGNNKELVGIDREEFDSHDQYERALVQLLNDSFGPVVVSKRISTVIKNIDGVNVCVVKCEPPIDDDIVYLNDEVFVRTGPRVDKLSTKEVVALAQSRVNTRKEEQV
ncbi:putative DNA binding domain-containing protein [Alphaproteobacteria bacterium]|nr:putative DNA binding domain-containing protein [Alphaproteobacteria bacterium]